jgi:hypothetical protein
MPNQRTRMRRKACGLPGNPSSRQHSTSLNSSAHPDCSSSCGGSIIQSRRVTWSKEVVDNARKPDDGEDLFSTPYSVSRTTFSAYSAYYYARQRARRKDPRESVHISRGHANQYFLALGHCDSAVRDMILTAFTDYPGACNACTAHRYARIFARDTLVRDSVCTCDLRDL